MRVLVVDDQRDVRETLAELLEDAGDVVFTARDGRAGLARVAETRPDVVVLDIVMPSMNGTEFLAALRATGAAVAEHVVVVTALPRTEAAALGAAAVVPKPFDGDALVAAVHSVYARGADGHGR